MTDDLLKEATRALREEGEESQGSDLTRARVMLSLHAAKRKRRNRLAFGVPLVAVFVAGAAAAQISGTLPRAIDRVVEVFAGSEPEPTSPAEPAKPGAGRSLVSATPSEPDPVPPMDEANQGEEPSEAQAELDEAPGESPPLEPRVEEPVAVAQAESPKPSPGKAHAATPDAPQPLVAPPSTPSSAPAPEAPASAPAPKDPSHARYLEAHQAHFAAHDYPRALSLWDRYLREFPRGRFAAEAQYNRALCLVRLGRTSEAKQALEPFASGRYGGYRQNEARALIDALGG